MSMITENTNRNEYFLIMRILPIDIGTGHTAIKKQIIYV